MVDEGGLDGLGVDEGLLAQRLVGAPALAGDDARARADVRRRAAAPAGVRLASAPRAVAPGARVLRCGRDLGRAGGPWRAGSGRTPAAARSASAGRPRARPVVGPRGRRVRRSPASGRARGVRRPGASSRRGSAPGSTSSRRRPCGQRPVASGGLRRRTRTSTPSESPTHSGAVAPRTRPGVALRGVRGRRACSSLWVSTSCQSDQAPVPAARVRTWTRPCSSACGVVPDDADQGEGSDVACGAAPVPRAGAAASAVRRRGAVAAAGGRAAATGWSRGVPARRAAGAPVAPRVGGRRESGQGRQGDGRAHATPIEEARNPRMKTILSTAADRLRPSGKLTVRRSDRWTPSPVRRRPVPARARVRLRG